MDINNSRLMSCNVYLGIFFIARGLMIIYSVVSNIYDAGHSLVFSPPCVGKQSSKDRK